MPVPVKTLFMRRVGHRLDPLLSVLKNLPSNPAHVGLLAHSRGQNEKAAANFEPIFKSLATSRAIMGIAPKVIGAQLGVAHQQIIDYRRNQAEKAAADVQKLFNSLEAASSLLKNRKFSTKSPKLTGAQLIIKGSA